MRNLIILLASSVVLLAPLSAQAGRGRPSSRGVVIPQRQAYRKAQTVVPENPALAQARQQHLTKLKADLEAIAPQATPTREQTTALYQGLMAVVDGSSKPTPASVQKLSADLAAVMSRRAGKSALDIGHLAQGLKVVMNSAYVLPASAQTAAKSSQQLLKAAGAPDPEAQAVANDLKTIVTEAAAQGRPGMIR